MQTAAATKPRVGSRFERTAKSHRTLWHNALRQFMRNRFSVLGLCLVAFFIFLAVFANQLAPHPYDKVYFDRVLLFPLEHASHPLGTDEVGRDYLSRLLHGARTSLFVGLAVQAIAIVIGVPVGSIAGYMGGKVDFVFTRVVDIMSAFPGLLFTILIISLWGGGLFKVIVALSITSWLGLARLTRAQFLQLRESGYVEAAICTGTPESRIIVRHIIPNALTPLLVAVSFGIPAAMYGEAGLSFLGIGINDPLPSWGKMVGVSNAYVRVYWHLALFPTIAIALAMLGFSFMGDGLRDALDPRLIE